MKYDLIELFSSLLHNGVQVGYVILATNRSVRSVATNLATLVR